MSWRDRLLIRTDLIGTLGSLTAPLTNWLMRNHLVRRLRELMVGVHRDRQVLHFSSETFPRWFARRSRPARTAAPVKKVALFSSCLVNYQATDIGKATVQVLEKNGVEVVVPEAYMGDVLGDLSARRGKIGGMTQRGEAQVIAATVPLAEMFGYSTKLRSMSQGRAVYSMEFAHYEEVPKSKAEEIVSKVKA